jgi:tetratricopeptide (TPR) repeat protein
MNGDGKGASYAYAKCVEIAKGIATADPLNREAQLDLAVAYEGLGTAMLLLKDLSAAKADLKAAREITARVSAHDPSNTAAQDLMADLDVYTGQADEQSGRNVDALDAYQRALTAFLQVSTTNKTDVQARLSAAATYNRIASVLAKSKRREDAIAAYEKSLTFAEEFASLNPPNESAVYAAADAYAGLGSAFVQRAREERTSSNQSEKWAEARSWFRRSLNSWQQIRNPGAMSPNGFFAGDPKEPARGLADCDAALTELKGSRSIADERNLSAK